MKYLGILLFSLPIMAGFGVNYSIDVLTDPNDPVITPQDQIDFASAISPNGILFDGQGCKNFDFE